MKYPRARCRGTTPVSVSEKSYLSALGKTMLPDTSARLALRGPRGGLPWCDAVIAEETHLAPEARQPVCLFRGCARTPTH